MGKYNGVRDLETLKLYVFGGIAGPTGRPVALLSFLIDDTSWPSTPTGFKRTNLLLHLLTGIILFAFIRSLLLLNRTLSYQQINRAALLSTAIWLLHPLLVSTTLYVVQRMAILSAMFVLLGLWGYIHGRIIMQTKPRSGYVWMSSTLIACTALAVLSKENGILLLPLALLMEQVLLKRQLSRSPYQLWKSIFLLLPSTAIFGYLLYKGVQNHGFDRRPFSLLERLLTEPEVLFNYLRWWLVPGTNSPGLLFKGFTVSQGLLNPPGTLVFVAGLLMLTTSAIFLIKKKPYLSFAILFFLLAHSMEAGPIALELYFEHRNYLPAVFLALPLALFFSTAKHHHGIAAFASFGIIIALALFTYQRAVNWSDQERLANHWAKIHPYSQRAQRYAALVAEEQGHPGKAISILTKASHNLPNNIPIQLHLIISKCKYTSATKEDVQSLIQSARDYAYHFKTYALLESFAKFAPSQACHGVTINDVWEFLNALQYNSGAINKKDSLRQLQHLSGLLFLKQRNGQAALEAFLQNQQLRQDAESGLAQVALLASHQYFGQALELILFLKENVLPEHPRGMQGLDYAMELDLLEKQIKKDLSQKDSE